MHGGMHTHTPQRVYKQHGKTFLYAAAINPSPTSTAESILCRVSHFTCAPYKTSKMQPHLLNKKKNIPFTRCLIATGAWFKAPVCAGICLLSAFTRFHRHLCVFLQSAQITYSQGVIRLSVLLKEIKQPFHLRWGCISTCVLKKHTAAQQELSSWSLNLDLNQTRAKLFELHSVWNCGCTCLQWTKNDLCGSNPAADLLYQRESDKS